MQESVTPTRPLGKLDSLPKDELIKYIKKQVSQMKDLKKKNEGNVCLTVFCNM